MIDIEKIHKDIVLKLNIGHFPEQTQKDIMNSLAQDVFERVILELIQEIPEDKRGAFNSLHDPKEVESFVRGYVPDCDNFIQGVIEKEITEFKKEAGLN